MNISKRNLLLESSCLFALTLGCIFLIFPYLLSKPEQYFAGDLAELYYPGWIHLNSSIRNFHLPVLNRFWWLGSLPFAPLECGVFYPPFALVSLIFDARKHLDFAFIVLMSIGFAHYILASISFYLLTRLRFKLAAIPSMFGGLVYACTGSFVGRFNHLIIIYSMALLPLLFFLYLGFLENKKIGNLVLCAIILALAAVCGHPQWMFYTYAVFLSLVLYGSFVVNTQRKARCFIISIATILLSMLLAAPRILLLNELSQNIIRVASDLTLKNLFESLHPLYYLTLFTPYLFGKHQVGYWGSDHDWGNWESLMYLGSTALLLIPLAFFTRDRKWLKYFVLMTLGLVFLMLGKYLSVSAWLVQHIPLADKLTILSRFTTFTHFFMAVLVAFGCHVLTQPENRFAKGVVLFITLLVATTILSMLGHESIVNLRPANRPPTSAAAIEFVYNNILNARILFATAGALVVCLFYKRNRYTYALLFVFFGVDIHITLSKFNPIEGSKGKPTQYFFADSAVEFLKTQDYLVNRNFGVDPHTSSTVHGIEGDYGYFNVRTKALAEIAYSVSYDGPSNRNVFDMAGLKYLHVGNDMSKYPNFELVMPNLWLNKQAFRRAEFVPNCFESANIDELRHRLFSGTFNPRNEILIQNESGTQLGCGALPPGNPEVSEISVRRINSDDLEIESHNTQDGFLFLGQVQYPGWNAELNGKPVELLKANLAFYGVKVASGYNKLILRYNSWPVEKGMWGFGLGLFVILLISFYPRYRNALSRWVEPNGSTFIAS